MEKEKKGFKVKGIDSIDSAENLIEDASLEDMVEDTPIIDAITENISEYHNKLKAHKIGNLCLTLTTIVLVILCLFVDASFAPFIVLLMSSRIGSSLYMVIKQKERKEIIKLIIWIALFSKSMMVCFDLIML